MAQWRGDDVERDPVGTRDAGRADGAGGAAGDAPRSDGGGSRRGPVLLLVGVLVGALIALGALFVVERDSGDGTSDVGAASTEPGTGVPSIEENDDGSGSVSSPASTSPDASDKATSAPTPTPPQPAPEPTDEPDVFENGVNMIAPAAGTYSGLLYQRGTEQSDQSLQVAMSFSSTGSYVDYPTLGCSGTLTPTGNRSGARVYRETITSGQCDPTGTWYVTRGSDTEISAEYRPSGDDHVVEGQLSR